MWMEKRNGKYRYSERYVDYLTGKTKRLSVTLSKKNDKLAFNTLQEKINAIQLAQNGSESTFGQLVDKYIAYSEKNLKLSTARRNKFFCKSFLELYDEDILCNRITAGYIKEKLDETNKSNSTKNEFLERLKTLMRFGYHNDYIDDIRWIDKLIPYKDDSDHVKVKDKYLEDYEIVDLISSMEQYNRGKHWILLTKFLILSGMRIGEAIALEKKDVQNDRIIINKTYDKNNGIVSTPKTLESNREISIQKELREVIKEINIYYKLKDIQSIYFFSNRNGQYISYDAYLKYIREHSANALGRKITPHVLRHTHASMLAANGVDLDTITRRLGHADSKVTKEIYLHITKKLKENDSRKIKDIKLL